ncbi:hypothetical protein J7E79_30305 [Bacillus sp. ISL-40]|uniref:YqgU-like beta propeller domain-containing protein n=1 Tax=Bacillus sp. ISL-77 TaxID=2819138 RepID=UPI001BE9D07A|nr:hypothetical protein [Bacillus sp. ISL-77]MBT2701543.1 hypothetical protein [Bacillus sp. ISL-40]MBT2743693.1 hypothetical protein [Bacillus sp. ISL-77]
MSRQKRNYPIFLILRLIFLILILTACAQKEQLKQKVTAKNEKPKSPATALGNEWKLPISIPEGEFYKFVGWLSGTKVLYITNLEQTSSVYQYNLLTGKSELIYKSEYPIVNVQISPSKKRMLIHTSPSSYEGVVTIIDIKGKEQLKKSFASYELAFEWNPYKESEILVTKFNEDWSFQVLLLDLNKSNTTELTLPQPFIKWKGENEVAFINWDENNPSLFAPLIDRSLENGMENTLFSSVIDFSEFHDLLVTVSVNEQDQSMANYSFFDKEMKKLFTFSIPQLTNYSDWLVPFYDYNEQKGQFFTFSPVTSGEADSYTEGFQLLAYNPKNGSSSLIMDGLENEPIHLSPSGDALLYGNQFEKIIDIKTKKIYELIKE